MCSFKNMNWCLKDPFPRTLEKFSFWNLSADQPPKKTQRYSNFRITIAGTVLATKWFSATKHEYPREWNASGEHYHKVAKETILSSLFSGHVTSWQFQWLYFRVPGWKSRFVFFFFFLTHSFVLAIAYALILAQEKKSWSQVYTCVQIASKSEGNRLRETLEHDF